MSDVIRVLLVDDQDLVRAGLRRILRPAAGFEIVGECGDGDEVEEAVARLHPDVVVLDIRMKRVDGVEATHRLRRGGAVAPVILALTTFDDDEILSAALRAGVNGFQLKDAPGEDIVRAVRTVAHGGAWLDPAVTERVLTVYRSAGLVGGEASASRSAAAVEALTPREHDVLRLLAAGRNNAEIAGDLFIGEVTVKTHVGHILMKLGLRDRSAAIVFAYEHGLVR
jgi:DNA-binding NarL/FixJ family response regulator